jgi:hypothetical protein
MVLTDAIILLVAAVLVALLNVLTGHVGRSQRVDGGVGHRGEQERRIVD